MDNADAKGGQKLDKKRTDEDYAKALALAERRGNSRAAQQPTNAKKPVSRPITELDPSHRARSVDEIAERLGRIQGATESDKAVTSSQRAVRKAERTAGDGSDISGTGYTILKMRVKPLERLVSERRIGAEELQAAEEITKAFTIIASPVMMRAIGYERVDGGRGRASLPPRMRAAKLVDRYQKWANHWSRLNKLVGDPMLGVVISAVIDERSIRDIAADVERDRTRVMKGLIFGLRDYAARAGFVSGARAEVWINEAAQVFTDINPKLTGAIRRARIEV